MQRPRAGEKQTSTQAGGRKKMQAWRVKPSRPLSCTMVEVLRLWHYTQSKHIAFLVETIMLRVGHHRTGLVGTFLDVNPWQSRPD